ncbi:ABC transporter permease [Actinomadura kijaniata]|uniref:ABC transporter permease n=1 Tax=Actinomadura kijaniata TaxID=46161 RepID=UPI0008304026|nr:ABC transporter permease [Actinomadura kijaniata]
MSAFTGTGALLRLALRRDRVMIPVWALVLWSLALSTVSSYAGLYDTEAERLSFIRGINGNASTMAFYGPVHGTSVGALSAWRLGTALAAMVAVMTVLLVVRHSRAEEEDGRLELVGAGVVGRRAPLTAALLAALVADALVALLGFVALVGQGAVGALTFALGWFALGAVFAAVAAVCVQLSENARTARLLGFAVLGAAFLVRTVADASESARWLSWLSPIGWNQQLRPFDEDRLWVLALSAALVVPLVGVGYALTGRRDLGAGVLAARLGPASAGRGLRSALGLAWRLQRGMLLAWTVGLALYGAIMGGVLEGVGDLVGDSPETKEIIQRMGGQQGLADAFLSTAAGMLGAFAAVYGVQAALRLRGEEGAQRLEPLLALSLGRVRWAAGHLLIALAGVAVILLTTGLAIGVVHGLTAGDVPGRLGDALGAVLVQAPAAWVTTGVAVALFGLLPRLSYAAWGVVGAFLLLGILGPALNLDQAVLDVSPFTHTPKLPGAELTATPLVVMTAVVAALVAAGLAGFRRRDVTTS